MKKVIYRFNFLSDSWKVFSCHFSKMHPLTFYKTILPRDLFLNSIGLLLDCVFQYLIESVLNLGHISPEETYQLRYLFFLLDEACPRWFEFKTKITSIGSRPQQSEFVQVKPIISLFSSLHFKLFLGSLRSLSPNMPSFMRNANWSFLNCYVSMRTI
jgi:hypothetical protein